MFSSLEIKSRECKGTYVILPSLPRAFSKNRAKSMSTELCLDEVMKELLAILHRGRVDLRVQRCQR